MKKLKRSYLLSFLLVLTLFISVIPVDAKTFPIEDKEKTIYLTFDDGPSKIITRDVLPILKEYDVRATFFIIGYKIHGKEDIIKKIYEDGHSIGVHTYSHKYKKIYSSEESFLDEMNETADEVKSIIGVHPNVIRFPFGSKNHLTPSLLLKLHDNNYRIYDWNASISDGLNPSLPPDKFFKEATRKCVSPSRIFLLMHSDDPNKNTCKALPKIIKYYRDLGYEFKPITNDTPEYFFRVKKWASCLNKADAHFLYISLQITY